MSIARGSMLKRDGDRRLGGNFFRAFQGGGQHGFGAVKDFVDQAAGQRSGRAQLAAGAGDQQLPWPRPPCRCADVQRAASAARARSKIWRVRTQTSSRQSSSEG